MTDSTSQRGPLYHSKPSNPKFAPAQNSIETIKHHRPTESAIATEMSPLQRRSALAARRAIPPRDCAL